MMNQNFKDVTVAIECGDGTGTGFFVMLSIKGGNVPVLVTAAHVVEDSPDVTLTLHYKPNENHIATASVNMRPEWISHDNKDLCCCLLEDLGERFKKIVGFPISYRCIGENKILTAEEREKTDVLSEAIMLGYPRGIVKQPNAWPLFQHGYLSSIPSENENIGHGFVDITAMDGSSGSPLLLMGEQSCLIGIMSQAVHNEGETSSGLGCYVDASCLMDLKNQIEERKKND